MYAITQSNEVEKSAGVVYKRLLNESSILKLVSAKRLHEWGYTRNWYERPFFANAMTMEAFAFDHAARLDGKEALRMRVGSVC
jgi:hypothetical protein